MAVTHTHKSVFFLSYWFLLAGFFTWATFLGFFLADSHPTIASSAGVSCVDSSWFSQRIPSLLDFGITVRCLPPISLSSGLCCRLAELQESVPFLYSWWLAVNTGVLCSLQVPSLKRPLFFRKNWIAAALKCYISTVPWCSGGQQPLFSPGWRESRLSQPSYNSIQYSRQPH